MLNGPLSMTEKGVAFHRATRLVEHPQESILGPDRAVRFVLVVDTSGSRLMCNRLALPAVRSLGARPSNCAGRGPWRIGATKRELPYTMTIVVTPSVAQRR